MSPNEPQSFGQPPVQPPIQPPVQPPQTPTAPAQDPGKTLGIVGFVFAFIGLQVIGLILSIIGYRKSKKVGIKNSLALAGIIVNAVILTLAAILIPLLIVTTIASYSGITERANSSAADDGINIAELSIHALSGRFIAI